MRKGARWARMLAIAAAVSAAVIALYLLRDGLPDGGGESAAVAVLIALAAVPPVVLMLLAAALGALADLPRRIRETPAEARTRLGELGSLAEGARDAEGARGPLLLWRLLQAARSSSELLTPHAAVLPLASVPFLLLSAVSVVAAWIEVVVAAVLALALVA